MIMGTTHTMTQMRPFFILAPALLAAVLLFPLGAQGNSPTSAPGYRAEVHLVDGTVLVGQVVSETLDTIILQTGASAPTVLDKTLVRQIDAVVEQQQSAPQPTVSIQAPRFSGRLLGLGTNIGVGFGYKSTYNASPDDGYDDWHDDVELPGLELRLFPSDRFSVDLLWQIGDMTWFLEKIGQQIACMMIFAHFYVTDGVVQNARVGFSAAPGFIAVSNIETPSVGAIGLGTRLGVDLTSLDDLFGLGVYARPFVHVTKDYSGTTHGAFELVFEITWTWYVPRPVEI